MSRFIPSRPFTMTAIALVAAAGVAGAALAAGPGFFRGDRDRMAERLTERCERVNERLAAMDKGLTAEQIRDIVAGQLAKSGEASLKVGAVREKADGIVTVEIVTAGGSLVNSRDFSTKTGLPADAAGRCDRMLQALEQRGEHRGEHREGGRGMRGFGENGRGIVPLIAAERGQDLDLSADEVKTLAEAALVLAGNDRLKVGAVTEKDADTYTVEIVTVDNAVVVTRAVNRHTGHIQRNI